MIHAGVVVGCEIDHCVAVVNCGVLDLDCVEMVQDCGVESGYDGANFGGPDFDGLDFDGLDFGGPDFGALDFDGPDFGAIGYDLLEAMNYASIDGENLLC